jgi:peptidoglycan/LPS O-acetylase OafA/YrhL
MTVRQAPLDGVRGAAVLAIVAFHAMSDRLPGGYIGVDLFFVLSGFLITRLLLAEIEAHGRLDLRAFYVRRALRLLPALLLCCAVAAPLFVLLPVTERSQSLLGTLTAVTYASSAFAAAGADLGWMIHTWSLSVEEYFYLVWPFALAAIALRRHRTRIMAGVVALAIGYRLVAGIGTDWTVQRISYAPDTRAEQLLVGAFVAFLLAGRPRRVPVAVLGAAVLVFPVFVLLPARLTEPFYVDFGGSTVVAVAAAVLVAGLADARSTSLHRLAAWRPLVWVGERSYGIYLWNLPIVAIIAATPVPGPAQMPVKLVLTFLVPALSYQLVERPCLRLKSRYAAHGTAPVRGALPVPSGQA